MTRKETAEAAQRNPDTGELIYNPGIYGGTGRVEDDLSGIKAPANKAEAMCFEELQREGWTATKRGWPDFFCVRGGEICAVEVKPHKDSKLKRNQIAVMGLLADRGIPCFMWSPDGGFEEVKGIRPEEHKETPP